MRPCSFARGAGRVRRLTTRSLLAQSLHPQLSASDRVAWHAHAMDWENASKLDTDGRRACFAALQPSFHQRKLVWAWMRALCAHVATVFILQTQTMRQLVLLLGGLLCVMLCGNVDVCSRVVCVCWRESCAWSPLQSMSLSTPSLSCSASLFGVSWGR